MKRLLLAILLFCLSRNANAQRGIFLDSINANVVPASAQALKVNGIRLVYEYIVSASDSFLLRTFNIDTAGRTIKSTIYGKTKQAGHIDSFVYDSAGRLFATYSFSARDNKNFTTEFHYRYPAKDSVESSGYYIMADKSKEIVVSFTRLNLMQKPVEIKYFDDRSSLSSTTTYKYNEKGLAKEALFTNHRNPGSSYGYTYQYRNRKLILRNRSTGAISIECRYNRVGRCTDCIVYARPHSFPYEFHYDSDGFLFESIQEYQGNKGPYLSTHRFYYMR